MIFSFKMTVMAILTGQPKHRYISIYKMKSSSHIAIAYQSHFMQ